MATTEAPFASSPDKTEPAVAETKTVFNLLSKLKSNDVFVSETTLQLENDDDIVILRKDPETNQSTINRTAYLKLHRSSSPNRNSVIVKIKEHFEKSDDENEETKSVEPVKEQHSPSVKPPIAPKPRKSRLTKSQIITPKQRTPEKSRFSLHLEKNKYKDVNSNHVQDDLSSEEEFVTIVTRSDSEESVLQYQKELEAFTMDKKKRVNSFRKIFSVFSNKDKKKKQDKTQIARDNGENVQNESNSFSRLAPLRHTTGGEHKPKNTNLVQKSDSDAKVPNNDYNERQLERDYAQMHLSQFNTFRQNFENNPPPQGYIPLDKPNYTTNNAYINIPNVRKYIDTSSSASTLESDKSNTYQNQNQARPEEDVEVRPFRPSRIIDGRRDTPPRLTETKQDVRLVNPKALPPVNSDRPLPNPHENTKLKNSPYLDENYGTVLDSIDPRKPAKRDVERTSRSPPVEPTKLRLPSNREIIPLSPRIKSPIPPDNVSTEKIIATELLKNRRSATPTGREPPTYQKVEVKPNNVNYASKDNLTSKPPLGAKEIVTNRPLSRSSNESVALRRPQVNQASPITTSAQVHMNSTLNRTPTPNNSLSNQNLSLSPIKVRPLTPNGSQILLESPKKEDIRKSVEAYYWKEIRKMKDQETILAMQYANMYPYGYIEDPVSVRRSRSMSPSANRNGRRSLSLPREIRPPQAQIVPENYYQNAIPENRAVVNHLQPRSMQQLQFQQQQQQRQQQYFQRNAPERSTVDGSPNNHNSNSLYRPIFKRGSLSTPPRQLAEDSLKRKVSFSGTPSNQQNVQQSWPTKTGFVQSPPQRRIDKSQSGDDDDVFYPSEGLYYTRQQPPNNNVLLVKQNGYLRPMPLMENPYGQRSTLQRRMPIQSNIDQEVLYGQPIDAVRPPMGMTRHGSIQIQEELYGPRRISAYPSRPSVPSTPDGGQYVQRRPPAPLRREIIVNDDIFGQFGSYTNSNNVRVVQNPNVRVRNDYYVHPAQKQVSVSNKVCDIYGQIHDVDQSKVQQSGILIGQLQQQAPDSPGGGFARNSRLTASANDMYRRMPTHDSGLYGRIEGQNEMGAPNRPLPPVPQKRMMDVKSGKNNAVSDTESSDANEVQRILKNGNNVKNKKRGIFGK